MEGETDKGAWAKVGELGLDEVIEGEGDGDGDGALRPRDGHPFEEALAQALRPVDLPQAPVEKAGRVRNQ